MGTETSLSPSRCILSRGRLTAARAVAAAIALALAATPAAAHGFGQRYDLPIPLSYYLVGTAAAVAVSFLIVGLFARERAPSHRPIDVDLLATPIGRVLASPLLVFALKFVALAAFIITVVAGLRGDQNPYRNIAPTLVWTIWWIGLAYVSALLGNLWAVINPWRTIFEAAETLYHGVTGQHELSLRLPYPPALRVWPAVLLLLTFAWIELVYASPAVPRVIAWLAIGYSILTFAGMFLFGGRRWLERGEVFTLVFGTFARFAPVELRTGEQRALRLRPVGAGVLEAAAVSTSMMAFVLLLLASVLFDGALGTPEWGMLERALAAYLPGPGDHKLTLLRTVGLIGFWLVLLGAYIGTAALMSTAVAGVVAPLAMARHFALTLVPIAIGYHVAHYLTFLLVQGQYVIPLLSDPFGFGWDLFGTAAYRVDIAVVGGRFSWYAAVAAILLGHIAAVHLAHRKAFQLVDTRAAALRSQVPLTALMVVYTFVSLSILAEPLVERAPSAPAARATEFVIPEDAVLPEPATGRLQPVGDGKIARQKLNYRVMGSAFHDGTRMSTADLLYAYMFAYRWGSDGAHGDPLLAAATATMRAQLLGVRALGSDRSSKSYRIGDFEVTRELLMVEVYSSAPAFDREQDAVVTPPWSTLPWHLIVLMEEAVDRGWAAFSKEEAQRRGVEWLDLVRSTALTRRMAALAETFAREGYRPETLQALVSPEDARARWAALAALYRERGHLMVTNGPYRLKQWSQDMVVLDAFRDLSYPLGVGSYDAYAVPRRGFVTGIERAAERITVTGDIELIQRRMRSYDLVRTPLKSVAADTLRRAAPQCRYVVTDGADRVVLAGAVPLGANASFHIDLVGRLRAGSYTLAAQIIVNDNAMNAEIEHLAFDIAAK
jgi:hypothetical protein